MQPPLRFSQIAERRLAERARRLTQRLQQPFGTRASMGPDDEVVARARRSNVQEPALLGGFTFAFELGGRIESCRGQGRPDVGNPQPHLRVGRDAVVHQGRLLRAGARAEIGQGHERELQALGHVNGEKPNAVGAFFLGRPFGQARRVFVEVAKRVNEITQTDGPRAREAARLTQERFEIGQRALALRTRCIDGSGRGVLQQALDQLFDIVGVTGCVQPAQRRHGVLQRRAVARLQVGEAAVLAPMQPKLFVGDAEQRRPQGRNQSQGVLRIVDGCERMQDVPDFLALEEQTPALLAKRDPRATQGVFVQLDAGGAREQNGHVARFQRAPLAAVTNDPTLVERPRHHAHQSLGLVTTPVIRGRAERPRGPGAGRHDPHAGALAVGGAGHECHGAWLGS